MSLFDEIPKIIAKSFGLSRLDFINEAPVTNEDNEPIGTAVVKYGWQCRASGDWKSSLAITRVLFSEYLGEKDVQRGAIFLMDDLLKADRKPLRSVLILDQHDALIDALKSINLMEPHIELIPGMRSRRIRLNIWHPNGSRELYYAGGENDEPSWEKLWMAIEANVDLMEALYQDEELTKALTKRTFWE